MKGYELATSLYHPQPNFQDRLVSYAVAGLDPDE